MSGKEDTVDIGEMARIIDHDNHDMRKAFRQFLSDPIMTPRYNIPLEEERERALAQMQKICDVCIAVTTTIILLFDITFLDICNHYHGVCPQPDG